MTTAARIRLLCAALFGGLLLMLAALLGSRSSSAEVFGLWSSGLFASMLLLLLLALMAVLTACARRWAEKLTHFLSLWPELSGPLLLFLLPLVFTLLWFFQVSPLFSRSTFAAGALLCSLVPGLSLILSKSGKKLASVAAGTMVMFLSLLIVTVISEIVLRKTMPPQIFNPRFGLRPGMRYQLQVELPGITPGGTLTTNSLGLRGEEPPENWNEYLTIVTIGGSTTANYYLDDSLTWSHVLQQELRDACPKVWVGNAGLPRHSTETHLLFLREVMPEIRPDVAVFLVGVNDMGPFLRGGGGSERLPDTGLRELLFRKSRIIQLLYLAKKVHIDGVPVVSTTFDPEFREVPMEAPEEEMPEDLHDLLEDPGFYRRRIAALIEECRLQGIQPVFLTQPCLYEDTPYWRGIEEAAYYFQGTERPLSAATYGRMLDALNTDLLEVCTEMDVPVLDLAAGVPHSRDMFYDSMHMTEAGAGLVGRTVAAYLLELLEGEGSTWLED